MLGRGWRVFPSLLGFSLPWNLHPRSKVKWGWMGPSILVFWCLCFCWESGNLGIEGSLGSLGHVSPRYSFSNVELRKMRNTRSLAILWQYNFLDWKPEGEAAYTMKFLECGEAVGCGSNVTDSHCYYLKFSRVYWMNIFPLAVCP